MAKTHRGKGIRHLPSHGRGACPLCGRTRIKLLYERTGADGQPTKVCKNCRRR